MLLELLVVVIITNVVVVLASSNYTEREARSSRNTLVVVDRSQWGGA